MASEILPDEFLELFKDLKKPPKKLHYKGNLSLLKQDKIAIIGSRRMSVYTKNCVFSLASMLKNAHLCVVSGGALGVDITASMAAMPNTIGIFANGLDQIYPRTNEKIIKQIYENALALSEYEDDYLPKNYDFLLRNRLVIALSKAVVVAQADIKSGSMQSAKLALELNKPLYVLPQRLEESTGTNFLLKENKAKLICDFKEFVSEFASIDINQDEFLEFCKKGVSVDEALKFMDKKFMNMNLRENFHRRAFYKGFSMRALALDVGLKRIGVALCIDKKIALPLDAVLRKNRNQAANEIKNLLKIHEISLLIVGIPKGGSSEEEMTRRIKHFVSLLEFDKEICFVDESGTSKEALGYGVANTRKKDGKLDSLSAFIMIKDYFAL